MPDNLILAFSQTVEKIKPFVIGKLKKPRTASRISIFGNYRTTRNYSKSKVWTISSAFTELLKGVNIEMAVKRER